jgi:YfiH family protein
MPFHQTDGIEYYTFSSLEKAGLVHAVFTRKGGVSQSPWDSLNVGSTVGDDPIHVNENRRRSFAAMGRDIDTLYDVWQVHSADVVCTDCPRPLETPHLKADAIITNKVAVTSFMRFADCVPILLFDPIHKVIGLVHAGWQGTVKKVGLNAVQVMQQNYGCDPGDILAAIGPSICVNHYPVGNEVVNGIKDALGEEAKEVCRYQDDQAFLDLWRSNAIILRQSGVINIEIAGQCTACDKEHWYSHRGENGCTGRFGVMIALEG